MPRNGTLRLYHGKPAPRGRCRPQAERALNHDRAKAGAISVFQFSQRLSLGYQRLKDVLVEDDVDGGKVSHLR